MESLPVGFVISDMLMAGNPMVFVNQEFCRITGYSKDEAQGRNCRFLQGPDTEPASVAVIQDTLRQIKVRSPSHSPSRALDFPHSHPTPTPTLARPRVCAHACAPTLARPRHTLLRSPHFAHRVC